MILGVCGIRPVASERIRLQSKLDLHKSVQSQFISERCCLHTVIESFQLIAGNFRIMHALQEWLDTSIFFAPEVVGNYICQLKTLIKSTFY